MKTLNVIKWIVFVCAAMAAIDEISYYEKRGNTWIIAICAAYMIFTLVLHFVIKKKKEKRDAPTAPKGTSKYRAEVAKKLGLSHEDLDINYLNPRYATPDGFTRNTGKKAKLLPMRVGKKYGFQDRKGNTVIEARFDDVKEFAKELCGVKIGRKWGFVDKGGNLVIEARFDDVKKFAEELCGVKIGRKWGFVDEGGNLVIETKFADVRYFDDGIAAAKKGFRWGYINLRGDFIVRPKFADVHSYFSEGLAGVCKWSGWGYIDMTGKVVIPCKYATCSAFKNGVAEVETTDYAYDSVSPKKISVSKAEFHIV